MKIVDWPFQIPVFFNENLSVLIHISLKFVSRSPIDNMSSLVLSNHYGWLNAKLATSHYLHQ